MKRENVYTEIRKRHVTISTSLQVLQYLRPSTRVLTAKYSSTDEEVPVVCYRCVCQLRCMCHPLDLQSKNKGREIIPTFVSVNQRREVNYVSY